MWWDNIPQPIEIALPVSVSPAGLSTIRAILDCEGLAMPDMSPAWDAKERHPWVSNGETEFSGKFTKRLNRILLCRYGEVNKHAFWHNVLNTVAKEKVGGTYLLDFTQDFDWAAGEYGDDGSCFWTERYHARNMLAHAHSWAARLYNEEKVGIGRAWLIPAFWDYGDEEAWQEPLFVVNGYMTNTKYDRSHTNDHTRFFTSLLMHRFSTPEHILVSKEMPVTNQGGWQGILYLNGGRGFVVGSESDVGIVTRHGKHDFDIPEINIKMVYDNRPSRRCIGCAGVFRQGTHELYIAYLSMVGEHAFIFQLPGRPQGRLRTGRSYWICDRCLTDVRYALCQCKRCEHQFCHEDMVALYSNGTSVMVCKECQSRIGICSECGTLGISDRAYDQFVELLDFDRDGQLTCLPCHQMLLAEGWPRGCRLCGSTQVDLYRADRHGREVVGLEKPQTVKPRRGSWVYSATNTVTYNTLDNGYRVYLEPDDYRAAGEAPCKDTCSVVSLCRSCLNQLWGNNVLSERNLYRLPNKNGFE